MHLYESNQLKKISIEKRNTRGNKPDDSAADLFIGNREDFDMDIFLRRKKKSK